MLKRIFAIGLTAVAFGSLAFVDATTSEALAGQEGYRPVESDATCAKHFSFEEIQNRCGDPRSMGWQREPKWFSISCTRTDLTWKQREFLVPIELGVSSSTYAEMSCEKACVSDTGNKEHGKTIVVQAPCREFTEMETTFKRDVTVSDCRELLSFSSVAELCDAKLKEAQGAWSFVNARETGNVVNTCGEAATQTPQR
ncbi:hypothetical protein [Polyangium jinanense]|uniref:Secreted protein n=1 Tax=Polyangium jinanense TaxID=2829994 RepID=A0A9X4AZL8_9BACT|nr:hypothetical protein [Polyangium jinanense]MDC3958676.1 hypothetical protein [Polyangium jinanense]MDC3988460.1 hypothetical protein [Polyangium jinanense]